MALMGSGRRGGPRTRAREAPGGGHYQPTARGHQSRRSTSILQRHPGRDLSIGEFQESATSSSKFGIGEATVVRGHRIDPGHGEQIRRHRGGDGVGKAGAGGPVGRSASRRWRRRWTAPTMRGDPTEGRR